MQPVEHHEPELLKHQKQSPVCAIPCKYQNCQAIWERDAQSVAATVQFQQELIQTHFSQEDELQHSKTQYNA